VRTSCAFCGCSDCKISKEHAWPLWVRHSFEPGPKHVRFGNRVTPVLGGFNLVDGDTGVRVNAVCKKRCNEGWMSQLENRVAPLLLPLIRSGASTTFTSEEQCVIAAWCCKTAMVFEFTASHPPFYTFEERDALRRTSTPPIAAVFLARRLPSDVWITLSARNHKVLCAAEVPLGQLVCSTLAIRSVCPDTVQVHRCRCRSRVDSAVRSVQQQLLHAPVGRLGHVDFVVRWTGERVRA
jgi:hypothetical protein